MRHPQHSLTFPGRQFVKQASVVLKAQNAGNVMEDRLRKGKKHHLQRMKVNTV